MLTELGIIATLLQWLHAIQSDRDTVENQATIDQYLEWLRRHNHNELLTTILESADGVSKLEQFVQKNYQSLLDMGSRILEAVTNAEGNLGKQIRDINDSLSRVPTKDEMQKMFDDLSDKVLAARERPGQILWRDVLRYKSLGEKLADIRDPSQLPSALDEQGFITSDRVLKLHQSIFPEGFVWAGKMRTDPVFITDTFSTASDLTDLLSSRLDIALAPPDQIATSLAKLCSGWNKDVADLCTANEDVKIRNLALFHYEFAVIHPFLDGNGRVNRLILNQQSSFIFGQEIRLQLPRETYYCALRIANSGEFRPLIELVHEAVARSRTALELE